MTDCNNAARWDFAAAFVFHTSITLSRAAPPIEPGACYWLQSDASESYCREHAIAARAEEFGLGAPLNPDTPAFCRTDLEDAFWDGIGASYDGESDVSENCSKCGETLSHVLTDYGAENELDHFLDCELAPITPTVSYELDRAFLNIGTHSQRINILRAFMLARRVLKALQ
jgi:hypothetical protein